MAITEDEEQNSGIGLQNVRKRLDILYGKYYHLDIHTTSDYYNVNLEIKLD